MQWRRHRDSEFDYSLKSVLLNLKTLYCHRQCLDKDIRSYALAPERKDLSDLPNRAQTAPVWNLAESFVVCLEFFFHLQKYNNHDIVRFLESIGAEFGACQNAHTTFDETVYELLVPLEEVEKGFQC